MCSSTHSRLTLWIVYFINSLMLAIVHDCGCIFIMGKTGYHVNIFSQNFSCNNAEVQELIMKLNGHYKS